MRILIAHTRYQQFGGEDVIAAAEAALLRARGHEVIELTVSNDGVNELTPLRRGGMAVWSRQGRSLVREAVEAAGGVGGVGGVDVAHFHNTHIRLSPAAVREAKALGLAVVMSLHNFRLICPRATLWRDGGVCEDCVGKTLALPALKHRCYRGSLGATATIAAVNAVHRAAGTWRECVDAYLVHTPHARELIARGTSVDPAKIRLKNNFVNEDPGPQGEPGEGLLYIGRLAEEKGIDTLLAAAERFAHPLTVAGTGPLEGMVRDAAAANGRVTYIGHIDHDRIMAEVTKAAATVVTSTWYEGQPMTILEAMACGRPVIASNLGAMPTVIDHGVSGLLFEPGDVATLASHVDTLLGDRPRLVEMGAAARRKFETIGTPDACYETLMSVYRDVTGTKAATSVADDAGSPATHVAACES